MRRKYLAVITIPNILPLADALSLANFQQITSILIPISCQLQYDSQIPTCTVSDFENGCSTSCQSALNSMAARVSNACSDVSVNSNTLLGIVMNGGVVEALCPAGTKTTTTVAKSTTPIAVSTTATQATVAPATVSSVTIPTESPGVTGGEGFSSKTSTTSEPIAQSAITTSSSRIVPGKTTSSKTTATTTAVSSSTLQSAAGGLGGGTTSSTTSKKDSASTTAASQSSQKAQPADDGSGGGSPFDISSSASRITSSMLGVSVMATLIGVLFGR